MADITVLSDVIKVGEGKWFKFTYTEDDAVVSMPATGYTFIVKSAIGGTVLYTATTFDVTQRASGIIRANLPATATAAFTVGTYYAEMEAVITTNTDVDKKIVKFKVEAKL